MSKQNNRLSLIDEIITYISELPLECQDLLLAVAKGMVFTKGCLNKQNDDEGGDFKASNQCISKY